LALKDLFYKSQTAMGDSKLLRSLKNNNIVALKDYYKSQGTPTENERNSTSEKGYSLVERFDMRMDTGGFFSIDRIPEGELTTMQIRELFSNKIGIGTHVRREFTFYREFESNGIIVEESADKGRKKGKWRAENNRLCIGWSNNHAKCAKVVHKNGNIVLYGKRGIGNNSIVVTYEKFVTIRD
jgi:hypothetical protein